MDVETPYERIHLTPCNDKGWNRETGMVNSTPRCPEFCTLVVCNIPGFKQEMNVYQIIDSAIKTRFGKQSDNRYDDAESIKTHGTR